jgi:endonuclease/exonuclease/phosphatase family metal-dependent hydrolase
MAGPAAIVCCVIRHPFRSLAACVLGLAAAAALTARAAGRRPPGGAGRLSAAPVQAAALAPAAAVAGVAGVALAATAAWWLAALLAVPAALLAAAELPRRRPRAPAIVPAPAPATAPELAPASGPARPGGSTFRVLTLNARYGTADPAAVVAAVRRYQVDVLAVQELTPELVGGLTEAGLPGLLPHVHADPGPRAFGAGLWSRLPLTPLPPVPGLYAIAPSASVRAGGHAVTVRSVHPVAPMIGHHRRWHQDLFLLRETMAAAAGPQVVAGDFNASRDHRPFRDLLAAGFADCADIAARRPWPGFTFPADRRFPPLMRLDHILVSAGITVSETHTVAVPGTDHRGVLAVLRLPPATQPARPPAPVPARATRRPPGSATPRPAAGP